VDVSLFERLERDAYTVFMRKEVLSLSYVPEVLVAREREEKYFAGILARGVKEDFLPPMIRVYGPPGSGKTAVVRSVLGRFSGYKGDVFRYFYVNLKGTRTVFMAANSVLSSISGRRVPNNLGLDRVFEEIWGAIRSLKVDRLFVVLVFDEVESVFLDKHYDPSDFFYRFLRHRVFLDDPGIKLCLVVITNNPTAFEDSLDARVRSSMGSEAIMFDAYSPGKLEAILRCRVEEGFKPECVEEGLAEFVSLMFDTDVGDARKSIDLLRVSGEIANERRCIVDMSTSVDARDRMEKEWVYRELGGLPLHFSLVLWYIAYLSKDDGKTSTGEVYKFSIKYPLDAIRDKPISRLGERRILEIITQLEAKGLLTTMNVSMGRRGYGKLVRLNLNPENVLSYYESNVLRIKMGV
jgi:orc1/cdc6 family replication initiation protein